MDRVKAEPLITNLATFNGVDIDLAIAIAETESSFDELAIRFEPSWKYVFNVEAFAKAAKISEDSERVLQMCSLGMMQVMGTGARELGFRGNLLELVARPEIGIKFGCLKIKELMSKYSYMDDLVSAYNLGTPRKLPDSRYYNQIYVNKVRSIYAARKSRVGQSEGRS